MPGRNRFHCRLADAVCRRHAVCRKLKERLLRVPLPMRSPIGTKRPRSKSFGRCRMMRSTTSIWRLIQMCRMIPAGTTVIVSTLRSSRRSWPVWMTQLSRGIDEVTRSLHDVPDVNLLLLVRAAPDNSDQPQSRNDRTGVDRPNTPPTPGQRLRDAVFEEALRRGGRCFEVAVRKWTISDLRRLSDEQLSSVLHAVLRAADRMTRPSVRSSDVAGSNGRCR